MCEIKERINSFFEKIDDIDVSRIQQVYDFYKKNRNICRNDDKTMSEENNSSCRELYEKLNEKLQRMNNNISCHNRITVFLSHSHVDFEYAYRIALYLKSRYNVDVYIDELDSFMPLSTNSVTAKKLSKKIREYDRFIFVGTEKSFDSKWCNWELGIADPKNSKGHLAFFVMNDLPEKNGEYRDNEYVELYPFIWDKKILKIESNDDELFVGYFKNFDDKESFITLKDWLYNNKNYFKQKNTSDSSQVNQKKTFAAFYFSKFGDDAKRALGYGNLKEAFSNIASRIGGTNNTYMLWRRREFNILFKNIEKGIDNSQLPQRVKRDYDRWNMKSFDDFTLEIRRMIGK